MHDGVAKKGFTLVELSLAIAFIGILSVTIALIISNTLSTYRRGLVLNNVNTLGMELVDDLRATGQNSTPQSAEKLCGLHYSEEDAYNECIDDGAKEFTAVQQTGKVRLSNGSLQSNVPLYGAFCTGTYSYIWNSGYFFNSENTVEDNVSISTIETESGERYVDDDYTDKPFKLLKIRDDTRSACVNQATYGETNKKIEKFKVASLGNATDILSNGEKTGYENNLAIYDLNTSSPVVDDGGENAFYMVSFIIGTTQGGINILSKGTSCTAPEDSGENFDYCAINKFNFAVRVK